MTTKDFQLAEKHIQFHSNGPRRWCKFCSGTPLPNRAEMPETRYEWVSVKEEIVEGRPHMPQSILNSTAQTLYDPHEHTDFKLLIRTGAGPQGELISNYKLYQIAKFDMAGFRLKAMATIELPIWRRHEEEWFRAFLGAPVQINDPGLAGTISSTFFLKVVDIEFSVAAGPKDRSEHSLVASMTMVETLGSTMRRHKGKAWVVLGTVVGAIISGGIGAVITILAN